MLSNLSDDAVVWDEGRGQEREHVPARDPWKVWMDGTALRLVVARTAG